MIDRSSILPAVESACAYAKKHIDLSGCDYGQPHWDGPFVDRPYNCYMVGGLE